MTYGRNSAIEDCRSAHKEFLTAAVLKISNTACKGRVLCTISGTNEEIEVLKDLLIELEYEIEHDATLSTTQTITVRWIKR